MSYNTQVINRKTWLSRGIGTHIHHSTQQKTLLICGHRRYIFVGNLLPCSKWATFCRSTHIYCMISHALRQKKKKNNGESTQQDQKSLLFLPARKTHTRLDEYHGFKTTRKTMVTISGFYTAAGRPDSCGSKPHVWLQTLTSALTAVSALTYRSRRKTADTELET